MTWDQYYIQKNKKKIFCNQWIYSKSALNIIITHTPIVSTTDFQSVYEPLTNYPVNIFAFDFSGTGCSQSDGHLTRSSILSDLDAVIAYIEEEYSERIFLYGTTGIGGIFAQYYVQARNNVKGFAQFACLSYGEMKGMGYPRFLVKLLCPLLQAIPNFKFTMKPPEYTGYHAELDEAMYVKMVRGRTDFWKTDSKFLLALLEMAVHKDSMLQKELRVPTLVFKTMHDRYFSPAHFDNYYNHLTCSKKMIEIDDVHNSYSIHCESFCKEVYDWFRSID
ncbi:alpha/beta hydrolase [Enterococcus florum]|uniref:Alpha/beta hydrolase n=1 Tax=Enterococcus florum TaxID=2480627 RepID=A0A4P5P7G0_9ENTE|nr:alpha/beta hydrolase [Enterococcus florum]GCF92121.1 alpha/beta hydrolase [Enterococcus florum]